MHHKMDRGLPFEARPQSLLPIPCSRVPQEPWRAMSDCVISTSQCICRSRLRQSLQDLLSTSCWENKNQSSANLAHGALTWSSPLDDTTGHANGSATTLLSACELGKLLRVKPDGEGRANSGEHASCEIPEREPPRTEQQRQRGTRINVVSRLIHAQGRVVRREARTRSCC